MIASGIIAPWQQQQLQSSPQYAVGELWVCLCCVLADRDPSPTTTTKFWH